MKDNIDETKDKLIAEKMIKRHRGTLKPEYTKQFFRKFFVYVKNLEEPEIDDDTEKMLKDVYSKARRTYNPGVKINARFLDSLNRMVISAAKLRGSNKIEKKDIDLALSILAKSEYKVNENINIDVEKKNGKV
jgi:DNA replicative helicase MCM subunit Mcm2 (Cdc46/Mcm family)